MDEGDGVEFAGFQLGLDGLGEDGLAPFDLEFFGLFAAFEGDVVPFVRKGPVHAGEDFFGNEIAEGTFHDSPSGGGAEENGLFGEKEFLKARLDVGVEILEIFAPVADHGFGKGGHGLG